MKYKVTRKTLQKKTKYIVRKKDRIYRGWNGECWRHFSSKQIIHVFTNKGPKQGMKIVQFPDCKERLMPENIIKIKKKKK